MCRNSTVQSQITVPMHSITRNIWCKCKIGLVTNQHQTHKFLICPVSVCNYDQETTGHYILSDTKFNVITKNERQSQQKTGRKMNTINHISATRFVQVLIRATADYIHLGSFSTQRSHSDWNSECSNSSSWNLFRNNLKRTHHEKQSLVRIVDSVKRVSPHSPLGPYPWHFKHLGCTE